MKMEIWFLDWKETRKGGATVVFQVAPDDLEWFKTLTAAKKGMSGQILNATFEIGEDETRETIEPQKPKQHHLPLKIKAYELCRDSKFQAWVAATTYDAMKSGERLTSLKANEMGAQIYIQERCGVIHRNEIDKNKGAAIAFGKILMEFGGDDKR